jgi:hypothetical protein
MANHHWKNLALPVALGIGAAYFNWVTVSNKLEPQAFVAMAKDIKPGDVFTEDSLARVDIASSHGSNLEATLIPWSRASALIGSDKFAQRSITKGELLTRCDSFEANVAKKAAVENSVIAITLSPDERSSLPVFVNDLVDIRQDGEAIVKGCRVLAISRMKEEAVAFRLELTPVQNKALEKRSVEIKFLKLSETVRPSKVASKTP